MRKSILAFAAFSIMTGCVSAYVTFSDQQHYDRAPVGTMPGGWSHVADVLNLPGRSYWRDRNTCGFGMNRHDIEAAYWGNANDLNQAFTVLAALPAWAKVEVFLLPGNGVVIDRVGSGEACTWRTRSSYCHIYDTKHLKPGDPIEHLTVRLEVFLPDVQASAPASPELLKNWIAELDSDRFAVREEAHGLLQKQGWSASAALRQALTGKLSPEQRRRVEELLAQSLILQLADLRIPAGLKVLSFDQLVVREQQQLRSTDHGTRWQAAERLHDAVEGTEHLANLLASLLDADALAAIRRHAKDAPKNTLQSFIPWVERPPQVDPAGRSRFAALRARIDAHCRTVTMQR